MECSSPQEELKDIIKEELNQNVMLLRRIIEGLLNAFNLSQPKIETRLGTLTVTKEQKFFAATNGEVKREQGVIYHYVPGNSKILCLQKNIYKYH